MRRGHVGCGDYLYEYESGSGSYSKSKGKGKSKSKGKGKGKRSYDYYPKEKYVVEEEVTYYGSIPAAGSKPCKYGDPKNPCAYSGPQDDDLYKYVY